MQSKESEPTVDMRGVGGRVFRRSFFLETLWNYNKMQNVGFVFCLLPALKKLYPDASERAEAVARHLAPVNTNPFMAPMLAGITARLEHDLGPTQALVLRKRVMTALAAQGDRIFWTHLRPLAAVWGCLLCVWFFGSIAGGVTFLVVYNVPHLLFRWAGFRLGWDSGLNFVALFASPYREAGLKACAWALVLGMGLFAGALTVEGTGIASIGGPAPFEPAAAFILPAVTGGGLVLLRIGAHKASVIYAAALTSAFSFIFLT
jgi:mannose/fructose/N-acetylgalactosamine-specific phosphotransferase system component IID